MAKLFVREGMKEKEVPLAGRTTIGRMLDNGVVLTDTASSRHHAVVFPEAGRWILEDLGSSQGTLVGGVRVQRHQLSSGDAFQIGAVTLRFEEEAEQAEQADPSSAPTALGMPAFVRESAPSAVAAPAVSPRAALTATPREPEPAAVPVAPAARPAVAAVPVAQQAAGAVADFAYAGFWRRFAATLVDGLVIGLPFFVLQRAVLGVLGYEAAGTVALGFGLLQLAVTLAYFARWESAASGATFGKKLLGIRVIDETGRQVSFGRALARNLGKILSSAICGLGFLFVAFTMRKCAWHDSLAGCLVVKSASIPVAGAARRCGACGWSPRPGLSFCTQCGQRLG
jgi:uncharacterized RDD family membrane protein YckC